MRLVNVVLRLARGAAYRRGLRPPAGSLLFSPSLDLQASMAAAWAGLAAAMTDATARWKDTP